MRFVGLGILLLGLGSGGAIAQPTSQPSSRPITAPTTRLVQVPASRPAVQVKAPAKTRPVSRPTPRPRPVVRKLKPQLPPLRGPFVTGWLSFALSKQDRIWLDGQRVGTGIVPYLRLLSGSHHIRVEHPSWGTVTFRVPVEANRHVVVLRKGKRVGVRYDRWERSNVLVRSYSVTGKPVEKVVVPGVYCVQKNKCPVLMPGDELYVQADNRYLIVSSMGAVRSARSYRPHAGDGYLTFYSYPPGALFLNNRMVAMAPVARLPLKPGRYKVWVRNGFLNMEWNGVVVIRSHQEVRKVVMTTPPKGANLVIRSKEPARIFLNKQYRGWTPAYVLPVPSGNHHVQLHRTNGTVLNKTLEVRPGQLEIVDWN